MRSIARASGISRSRLQEILHGKRTPDGGLSPITRVHGATERRLLTLEPSEARHLGKTSATTTWDQLREMIDFGIPKSRIALALGKKTPALQLSTNTVSDENARRVNTLPWTLWENHTPFRAVCACPLPATIQRNLETSTL